MRFKPGRAYNEMSQLSVTLFRDYIEDERWSMEVFADNLSAALKANYSDRVLVTEYRPTVLLFPGADAFRMRLSRFVSYPWAARQASNQLNHILDHAYGHLLYSLDPARTVVTVHDMYPLARWHGKVQGVEPGKRPRLNEFSFHALRRGAHLMADSQNTRRDLIELCGCDPNRITVVPLGISEDFYPSANPPRPDPVKRVLIVGAPAYKNRAGAFRIFARLKELCPMPLELVAVGANTPEWHVTAEQAGLKGFVRWVDVKNVREMAALYNCVDALLFPSLYEGFGLPVLEAMACGCPVVASNTASIPEVAGDAAILCAPADEDAFAQALAQVLTDNALRDRMVARGLLHAREFTWERTARATLRVYENVTGVADGG